MKWYCFCDMFAEASEDIRYGFLVERRVQIKSWERACYLKWLGCGRTACLLLYREDGEDNDACAQTSLGVTGKNEIRERENKSMGIGGSDVTIYMDGSAYGCLREQELAEEGLRRMNDPSPASSLAIVGTTLR